MSEYEVVEGDSPSHLCHKVSRYLRSGWKVAGGMVVVGNRYMQSMYLEDLPKPPTRQEKGA
jgi:hypothetical protein